MKLIEIISENAEDWAAVKGYDIARMQDQFSDKEGAREFLQNRFLVELKKLVGFLDAWESLSREHGYSYKYTRAAKMLAAQLVDAIEGSGALKEDLAQPNLKLIKKRLEKAALYFGSIGEDFGDVGEDKLKQFCTKLNDLLSNAANEIEIFKTSDTDIKKVAD